MSDVDEQPTIPEEPEKPNEVEPEVEETKKD